MCETCKIRWINLTGEPTDDNNPAIGRVRVRAYARELDGRTIGFPTSEWFPICAEHARRLADPGMEQWEFKSL